MLEEDGFDFARRAGAERDNTDAVASMSSLASDTMASATAGALPPSATAVDMYAINQLMGQLLAGRDLMEVFEKRSSDESVDIASLNTLLSKLLAGSGESKRSSEDSESLDYAAINKIINKLLANKRSVGNDADLMG